LSASEAGHLYRIIQEATSNSVKHSKATHFQIQLEKKDGNLQVTISDNGFGMDVQALEEGEHYGIRNMKARAEQMNTAFSINSNQQGTAITLRMPFNQFAS